MDFLIYGEGWGSLTLKGGGRIFSLFQKGGGIGDSLSQIDAPLLLKMIAPEKAVKSTIKSDPVSNHILPVSFDTTQKTTPT